MAIAVLLLPVAAFAQGSITGTVHDTSEAVLPGVTVEAASPVLIEKVALGRHRRHRPVPVVDLRPGAYTVTFSLTGFSTMKREGMELAGSFTATVNAELKVGAVDETVTVTGESPIVDLQAAVKQRVFTSEVVDAIPAGRSYMNSVVLVPASPSTQAARGSAVDVGGTTNLQTASMQIHGGRATDTRVMIDGVRIGNALATSSVTNFVPNQGAAAEVTVDYSSGSAEQPFGGLRIDLIPREGSNAFRGSIFTFFVNDKLQADNLPRT